MKNMNMKKKYWTMNLQIFAGDGGESDLENEGGDDDDDPGDDEDDNDDDDQEENEKKFSQKDVEDVVKKRLAREKRKWQREQQKKAGKKPNGKVKTGEGSDKDEDDAETQELRDKAAKADEMEMKWTCLEHDVDKACVDDVLALARVHMAKDEDPIIFQNLSHAANQILVRHTVLLILLRRLHAVGAVCPYRQILLSPVSGYQAQIHTRLQSFYPRPCNSFPLHSAS